MKRTTNSVHSISLAHKHGQNTYEIEYAGSSVTYLCTDSPHVHPKHTILPMILTIPNGEILESDTTCEVNIPGLPKKSMLEHILPGLTTASLLSIGELCDDAFTEEFTKEDVTIKG